MKTTIINAPINTIYLGDFLETLPYGILNKKNTGCGATTLAIENKDNYIIAVPTIQLVENKVSQYPNNRCSYNLLSVTGKTTETQIKDYLKNNTVHKIMVTYDSIPRLTKYLDINTYKVCVDEFQNIIQAYSYRDNAIDNMLELLSTHKQVTYLSATPLEFDFLPEQLESLPYTTINWQNTTKINVERIKTNNPYQKVANIIYEYRKGNAPIINGIQSKECYFFVNSVKAIRDILDNTDIKPNETKIVCANNDTNKATLYGYSINKATDENKPFTFITRCAFEGCDFYSKTGIVYIVSNAFSKYTLLDISTDIMQIAGRIRNTDNPFKTIIYHIYNTTAAEVTKEEFETELQNRIHKANIRINYLKTVTDNETREVLLNDINSHNKVNELKEHEFCKVVNNIPVINDIKIKALRYQHKIINYIYTSGISVRDSYLQAGFNVSDSETYEKLTSDFKARIINCKNFREALKEFIELKKEVLNFGSLLRIKQIAEQIPFIPECYKALGESRIKALGYEKAKIIAELTAVKPKSKNALLYELKKVFKTGAKYSNKFIKQTLTNIYTELGIDKKAKATDITEYFDTENCKNENRERAILLLKQK